MSTQIRLFSDLLSSVSVIGFSGGGGSGRRGKAARMNHSRRRRLRLVAHHHFVAAIATLVAPRWSAGGRVPIVAHRLRSIARPRERAGAPERAYQPTP
jgi:hypothetical protein